jgi:class 3 adenylate cyclase
LTDQDLKDLGIVLGDRRKILRAIAALDSARTAQPAPVVAGAAAAVSFAAKPTSAAATSPQAPSSPAAARAAGERRYLTVMFCDLVGSTAMSAQLDAEEWRDLVGAYLDAASTAVAEMGGHVAKKLGDGLMCLFGYPLAHENDAERAARAALSIQRALAELNRENAGTGKPQLVARIGLESGPAVLDAGGEIYGDVANIAARVQALAEPGAVLVTARVQRQVAGLFVAEERGTQSLKGVPEPTALFQLVRASGGGRRSRQRNLTPLVGRDEEIAMLMRRWERARQGEGQLVLIVGEPGLGKSRLIEEFHADYATRRTRGPNGVVRSFCRTRRYTRLPIGVVSVSAAPMCPLRNDSRSWRICWTWSSLIQRRMLLYWLRCSTFHYRPDAPWLCRRRNCGAAS